MATDIDDLFKRKRISPAKEEKLISAIIKRNLKAAKRELAENYVWLAYRIARKYRNKILNTEDRLWSAVIALFIAIDQVGKKPKKKKFEDYARTYIEKRMRWTVEDQRTFTNIPVGEVDKLNKITDEMKKTFSEEKIRRFGLREMEKLEKKYNKMK